MKKIELLRWDAIDWLNGQISTQRVKGSESGIHPLQADEVALLGRLQGMACYWAGGFLFVGEGMPVSRNCLCRFAALIRVLVGVLRVLYPVDLGLAGAPKY
jgi:hypothetical protein